MLIRDEQRPAAPGMARKCCCRHVHGDSVYLGAVRPTTYRGRWQEYAGRAVWRFHCGTSRNAWPASFNNMKYGCPGRKQGRMGRQQVIMWYDPLEGNAMPPWPGHWRRKGRWPGAGTCADIAMSLRRRPEHRLPDVPPRTIQMYWFTPIYRRDDGNEQRDAYS